MDVIDRAIEQNWQHTDNKKLSKQTWAEFEKASEDKKLFLFGGGRGAEFYFFKYKDRANVEGIIDNNPGFWGRKAQEIIREKIDSKMRNLKFMSISALDTCDKANTVVLITSLKFFTEIADQLEKAGMQNYFALLPMEAMARNNRVTDMELYDKSAYVKECCKKDINSKKIVFITMSDYAGHGKEIVKQLLRLRSDLDIVWIVQNLNTEVPKGIRIVQQNNWQGNNKEYIYEMETAGMWICDTGIPMFMEKRDGQIYIQIKHWASVTLKAFGFDLARFRQNKSMIKLCEKERSMIDYIITGSKFDTETCRRGFDFSGEVVEAGSPRTDILFESEQYRDKICDYYQIDSDKRMLLYAPTFRSGTGKEYNPKATNIDLDFAMTKTALEEKFGGEWLILLRLHPVVANQCIQLNIPEYVINVSGYYDSEELIAASDVLITDYSSIMFEPAFVKKPVFLLACDKKEYIDGERTLLIEYDTLPFPIAEDNDSLIENISRFEQAVYEKTLNDFFEKYGVHEDGHAGERAADFISKLIDVGI